MAESKPGAYVRSARSYARAVLAGRIPAAKWTAAACRRQLDDLERAKRDKSWPYLFDTKTAERVCYFIELLAHIKGEWAGSTIRLEPWQRFILTTVFGWTHRETGHRRFRIAYIEVPRKNAKSTLTSALGIYMLALDGEEGAEVYSAATKRDQARIVFRDAQAMVRKSPELRRRFGVVANAHSIHVERTGSRFEALSAEGSTLDGLNVHFGAIDELHAHKSRAVFDVIETAMGARAQPLLWLITTAGSNRAGICYEQRTYLTRLLDGVVDDDSYFGIIYTLDDGDDWREPKVWAKANPNLGVSVYQDDIERLARKAMAMASAQGNFLTKRLNVWVNADSAWMDMAAWERCADPDLDIENFAGESCRDAVDLASKVDIAAHVRLFRREIDGEQHYYAFGHYYLPEEAIQSGNNSQYAGWELEGRLIATPGNVTDIDRIETDIKEDASRFEIREVAYDPFQATQFANRLGADGFEMVEVRPTVLNFSEPMKELEALVLAGRFHHDGCPVLAWMVSNVVCHLDAKDNIYPRKERPENKIDGVVALIMALARWLADDGQAGQTSYLEDGDLLML